MRKLGTTFAAFVLLLCLLGRPAFAEPRAMGDGGIFDPEFYAAANPDVAAIAGTSAQALYRHYLAGGRREGRLPYAPAQGSGLKQMPDGGWFDASFYAGAYQDLSAKLGYNEGQLYEHFLKTGRAEGRLPYAGSLTGSILAAPPVREPALLYEGGGYRIYLRNVLPVTFVEDRQTGVDACSVTGVTVQTVPGQPWPFAVFGNTFVYQSHIHSFYYRVNLFDASGKLVRIYYVSLEKDAAVASVALTEAPGTYSMEIVRWW